MQATNHVAAMQRNALLRYKSRAGVIFLIHQPKEVQSEYTEGS